MAGITINVKNTGLLKTEDMAVFKKKVTKGVKESWRMALKTGVKETKIGMRSDIASKFKKIRSTFPNSVRGSIYSDKPEKMASAVVYSDIVYFNIFETGGEIVGAKSKICIPILPPLNAGRKGRTEVWHEMLKELRAQKKTFIVKAHGHLILMMKTGKDDLKATRKMKKLYKRQKGLKRLKSGSNVPIGFFVDKITMKPRFNFTNDVTRKMMTYTMAEFANRLDMSKI